MITEIYLVRHADSDYASGSERTRGLSERGRNDARIVTALLLEEGVQVVCSSPYVRSIQTIKPTAAALEVPIDIDERFRERDFVDAGYVVEDRLAPMLSGFEDPDFSFPGGESNRDVEHRGIAAIERVLDTYPGKRVAIGIHGGIMVIIMRHYDAQFGAKFLKELHKPDVWKLTFIDKAYAGAERIGSFGV